MNKEMISLESEIRSGYEVSEKLKKIWNCQLNMMVQLLDVCKKYDLKIIAYAGTLLGAVRHHGFIPWDDDMDFAMPRKDFNKLLEIGPKEFQSPLFFQTALTDSKFFIGYARLRDDRTTGMITWNQSKDYHNGIYIDIYVLDGITNSKSKLKRQLFRRDMISQLLKVYYADESYISKKSQSAVKVLQWAAHRFKYEKLYGRYCKIISKYNAWSGKIGAMTHAPSVFQKYWCYPNDPYLTTTASFENIQIPIPAAYDTILSNCFGDYMSFPPESERGKWHNDKIEFDPDVPYSEFIEKRKKILKEGDYNSQGSGIDSK